jgi:Gas vesicle protein
MTSQRQAVSTQRDVALVEVLDRALGAGVVITGDVTLSLADIDLVYLNLRLLIGSVGTINGEVEGDASELAAIGTGGDGPA